MLNHELINLRYAGSTSPYYPALYTGELKRVAPWIAVKTTRWESWPWHKQQLALTLGAGLSAHRASLVAKSAARIRGIWVIPRRNEIIELASPSGSIPPQTQWPRKYYRMARIEETTVERAGVRVTNPARTCLDIARLHGFAEGLVAVDSALRAGLVSVEDLKETRAAMARMKGPIPMKMAVEHAYAGSESPYESLLRALIIERIPAATVYPQFRVLGKYRADLCIDGWLIIEVDGDTKYDGTYGTAPETVVKEQMRRQREIENQQFTVLRFGPKELVNDPNSVVETICEYLDRKAGKVA